MTVDYQVVRDRSTLLETVAGTWPDTCFTVHGLGNSRTYLRWTDGAPEQDVRALLAAPGAWANSDGRRLTLAVDRTVTWHTIALGYLRTHRAGVRLDTTDGHHGTVDPGTATREEVAVVAALCARARVPEHEPRPARARLADLARTVSTYADAVAASLLP